MSGYVEKTWPLATDAATQGSIATREAATKLSANHQLPARGKTQGASTGADVEVSAILDALDFYKKDIWAADDVQTTGGSANAQTITNNANLAALAAGMIRFFKAGFSNTGACTLNENALGAVSIVRNDGTGATALVSGEILVGVTYIVEYNGTSWLLLNSSLASPAGGASAVPTGTVLEYTGFSAPTGFVLCDGTSYTIASQAALAAVLTLTTTGNTHGTAIVDGIPSTAGMDVGMPILGTNIPASTTILSVDSGSQIHLSQNATGTTTGGTVYVAPYGAADTSHFNVPDFRGKAPVGAGTGTGLTHRALGTGGGEENHLLTGAESGLPSHAHQETAGGGVSAFQASGASGGIANSSGGGASPLNTATAGPTSAASAHNTMQPYLVTNKIIKT